MRLLSRRAVLWAMSAWLAGGLSLSTSLAQPSTSFRPTPNATLCDQGEATVFSCPIGQKVVSLCSVHRPDKTVLLRYVFGKPGRPELTLTSASASAAPMTYGGLSYSGGGGDYVRVRNGRFSYVVYQASGHGWEQQGLVVERNRRRISARRCGGARLALGPNRWRDVYAAHLPDDPLGFEKPD